MVFAGTGERTRPRERVGWDRGCGLGHRLYCIISVFVSNGVWYSILTQMRTRSWEFVNWEVSSANGASNTK